MINFTQAFDLAWERMHVILFRPFDLGKWCAIALGAFLAALPEGGNGFNPSFNTNSWHSGNNLNFTSSPLPKISIGQLNTNVNHLVQGMQIGFIVLITVAVAACFLAVMVLLYWLGARGQFILLDNLVRNRGAVTWPWHYYQRQANSVLGLYLLLMLFSIFLFVPVLVVAVLMGLPLLQAHRLPEGSEIITFTIVGVVYVLCAIVFGVVFFVFREFGIPLMFRQGLLARPAFWASLKLIQKHPGSIAVFVLLRLAIFVAVAVVTVIVCCATCCAEMIPYVGTVLLLPVVVYVRCFTLDCLSQFGPEYDVWTVDAPPIATPPLSPPPQPG